jgi:hypothetical protein
MKPGYKDVFINWILTVTFRMIFEKKICESWDLLNIDMNIIVIAKSKVIIFVLYNRWWTLCHCYHINVISPLQCMIFIRHLLYTRDYIYTYLSIHKHCSVNVKQHLNIILSRNSVFCKRIILHFKRKWKCKTQTNLWTNPQINTFLTWHY